MMGLRLRVRASILEFWLRFWAGKIPTLKELFYA
jgi:hypothetical protein